MAVEGHVNKPGNYQLEDFLAPYTMEDRVYRMRCVEAWSMVVPWRGFPLADLVKRVEPTGDAKFLEFTTIVRPSQMPGQRTGVLDWPYIEGLRMDEATNPLTLLVTGRVRQGPAQPERCAAAADHAVEVRLQGHQVHREDPLRRGDAATTRGG